MKLNIWEIGIGCGQNSILIEVNGNSFSQQDFIYLQKLAEILDTQNVEKGKFKLGNLIIEVVWALKNTK